MTDQALGANEANLIRNRFREYYKHNTRAPSSLHMREFGFGYEKKIDFRHKEFQSELDLKAFIERDVPLFMSYSAAYYRYPAAQPMPKKEYLGADLIFDLDAATDHANHNKIYCPYCLETVKADTIRLVEEFLIGDFGFIQDEISINFSGQKGYHIHMEDKKFRSLTQEGRKQLLNYITAKDLDLERIIGNRKSVNQNGRPASYFFGPNEKSTGWGKKLYVAATEFIKNAKQEDLAYFGLRKKDAISVVERKEYILQKMAEGNWDLLKGLDKLWENILQQTVSLKSVNIDRNVTFDLARLIRLPDSLHGDTGFIAKSLTLSELKGFDPSRDATAFKGRPMRIRNMEAIEFDFAGTHYSLKHGEEMEVPEALGVLLLLKRQAKIV